MKKSSLACLGALLALAALPGHAVEILRWERLPLAVPLLVGQERIVFIDRNIRVGVPVSVGERLRIQSAGGALYLRANDAIEPTRLQLQDADSGALILLDIAAEPAREGQAPLEPVRIVEGANAAVRDSEREVSPDAGHQATASNQPPRETPIPVVLTRYAAQNLYAPLRTVEPLHGVMRVNLPRDQNLATLLPMLPVRANVLAAWRLDDQWVTAIRLIHTGTGWIMLDPRALQGEFVGATFQHEALGPSGTPEDTTVLYLVTRGHGLAQSLLPAVARFDPAVNLSQTQTSSGKEADHAQ